MKYPKNINLLGYVIKLDFTKSYWRSRPSVDGRIWPGYGYIYIDGDKREQGDTLLHEILHHIDNKLHIGIEEKQVRTLAAVLTELIRLNPKVIKFIQQSK